MKIVIEKNTGRAVYGFKDSESVELTQSMMVADDVSALDVNSATHEIVQSDAPQSPLVFVAGALAYDGTAWSIYDQEQYDLLKDQAAAQAATKLAEIRAPIWEQIKAIRDAKKLEGGYTTGGKWFHSDTFSRTQQLGLVMMGANIPANTLWKTMDGSFVTMTQTLAGEIFAAAAAQDSAMFTHAETLKAQVDASNDPASVDITVGWPATYVPA